eukprot:NODE_1447_length_968_cov_6.711643_g998_i0.p2 GENE.NODE_1447_length_968_cov_6.711643_g998_i0~~NODE_1447_length_968_cov_6.711643_g998_i0.p2  ORF type:complete len:139 (-),score=11.78 NODE_1447_length_968_cov_6.711643_g998_i0:88-504(-)
MQHTQKKAFSPCTPRTKKKKGASARTSSDRRSVRRVTITQAEKKGGGANGNMASKTVIDMGGHTANAARQKSTDRREATRKPGALCGRRGFAVQIKPWNVMETEKKKKACDGEKRRRWRQLVAMAVPDSPPTEKKKVI